MNKVWVQNSKSFVNHKGYTKWNIHYTVPSKILDCYLSWTIFFKRQIGCSPLSLDEFIRIFEFKIIIRIPNLYPNVILFKFGQIIILGQI